MSPKKSTKKNKNKKACLPNALSDRFAIYQHTYNQMMSSVPSDLDETIHQLVKRLLSFVNSQKKVIQSEKKLVLYCIKSIDVHIWEEDLSKEKDALYLYCFQDNNFYHVNYLEFSQSTELHFKFGSITSRDSFKYLFNPQYIQYTIHVLLEKLQKKYQVLIEQTDEDNVVCFIFTEKEQKLQN
jgi:hypothetical protein